MWWEDAVVYQLYPRSFADSNGDGIGDFEGIRSHLDHLRDLGVDAIWLSPCFPSPQADHGYDVADYFDIEPKYGTLADFDRTLAEAKERGIRILLDIVPNHCSSDHAWFQAALKAAPGSPERARYWFKDGKGPNGDEPPNNWRAIFGGSTWTRVTEADGTPGQWYFHTFTPGQPDFNWYNADVIDYFDRMLTFWFDRGVEGIRVDAVPVLGKDPDLPDVAAARRRASPMRRRGATTIYAHFHPSAHVVWKHWRTLIDKYEADHPGRHLFMISESYGTPEVTRTFLQGDEFHQNFAFELMLITWQAKPIRDAIAGSLDMLETVGGAPAWTQNNHDTQRIVTRLGRLNANDPAAWTGNNLVYVDAPIDLELGRRRARAVDHVDRGAAGCAVPVPGRGDGPRGVPRHARRGPRGSVVHPHQRRRDRSRRLPRPAAVDQRSVDLVRLLAARRGGAVAAAAERLGRAFRRARGRRSQLDAGLVPHAAVAPATCCRAS